MTSKCINVARNKLPFPSLYKVDEAFFIDVTQLFINSISASTTTHRSYKG